MSVFYLVTYNYIRCNNIRFIYINIICRNGLIGAKIYILNEDMNNLEAAKRHRKRWGFYGKWTSYRIENEDLLCAKLQILRSISSPFFFVRNVLHGTNSLYKWLKVKDFSHIYYKVQVTLNTCYLRIRHNVKCTVREKKRYHTIEKTAY